MEDRMELVVTNGSEAPTTADLSAISAQLNERLAQQGADLRNILEAEQQVINFLEGQLANHNERAKRLRRALAALEGEAAGAKPKAAKPPKSEGHRWHVSDEKVEEVYEAIVYAIEQNNGEPVTMTAARESSPHQRGGHETYRQAVDRLRDEERIRVAGRTRGGGTLLALMPEAVHAAA